MSDSENKNPFELDLSDLPGADSSSETPSDPTPNASSGQADFGGLVFENAPQEGTGAGVPAPESPATPSFSQELQALNEQAAALASSVSPSAGPIEQMKEFSEKVAMEKVQVPAAFPFSLMIEGALLPEEKEKLMDIISRENMGFREVDLEPQFESHRILIPRISEYAGVLLVQALRGTSARMRLGPSDSIFVTDDTQRSADPLQAGAFAGEAERASTPIDSSHPAERIAVTSGESLPQLSVFSVIDTLVASASLNHAQVETESSSEYQEILDSLQRELKYRAYRRGAVAIIRFTVQLVPLKLAAQYRLTVSGTAVKPESLETTAGPSLDSPIS